MSSGLRTGKSLTFFFRITSPWRRSRSYSKTYWEQLKKDYHRILRSIKEPLAFKHSRWYKTGAARGLFRGFKETVREFIHIEEVRLVSTVRDLRSSWLDIKLIKVCFMRFLLLNCVLKSIGYLLRTRCTPFWWKNLWAGYSLTVYCLNLFIIIIQNLAHFLLWGANDEFCYIITKRKCADISTVLSNMKYCPKQWQVRRWGERTENERWRQIHVCLLSTFCLVL